MIKEIKNYKPNIHPEAFVAETADIVGNVTIKKGDSIWYKTIIRAEHDEVIVGENSNIQDGCIIHVDPAPTIIGDNVTVGHGAILHACTIKNNALIGMGAIVLDFAEVGEGAVVGAGAVVAPRTVIPPNSLAMGIPAKVVKELDPNDQEKRIEHAMSYVKLWQDFHK